MVIWMTIEFAVLGGFLVYWVVSSTIMEDEIQSKQNYIDTMKKIREVERQHQTSEDDSEENWSD